MIKKSLKAVFIVLIFLIVILFLFQYEVIAQADNINQEYRNAIVTNIWIDSTEKLDKIKDHNIKYLIVDVGDIGNNGKLLTKSEDITYFLNLIKNYEDSNNYQFILLPYTEINTYNYNITQEFIDNFIEDHYNLANIGFDGIFVDIEPVRPDLRQKYISLLERLRLKLGYQKIISVYSGHILGNIDSKNEWEWDTEFLKNVSEIADIISVPVYDTSIVYKNEYKDFVKNTIDVISTNNLSSYFFLAVPTHKNPPETLVNSLSVFSKENKRYQDNKILGVDIFSEWTIDNSEWYIFEKYMEFDIKNCNIKEEISFYSYLKSRLICLKLNK